MTAFLVSLAFGVLITLAGIGFRAGWWPTKKRRAKWYHTWYRNEEIPAFQRKNGGATLPMGLGILTTTLGTGLLFVADGSTARLTAGVVFLVVGIVLMVAGFVMIFAGVPRFLQPRWLLDAERREAAGEPLDDLPMPPEGRQIVVSKRQYVLTITLLVAITIVALFLGQLQGALIGLALAIPILVATRVRGRNTDRRAAH